MKKSTKGLAIFLGCVVGTLLIIAIGITSVYVWLVEEPKITSEEFASHDWLERSSDSYLVPESNGDFKYYKSKDDLDDYYYTGTYEFYCGEDAVNYVVDELSDYKYGLTRDDIDDYIDVHSSEGYRKNRFVCLVLKNEQCIIEGENTFTETVITPYYGFYLEDPYKEGLELTNMREGSSYYFLIQEKED